MSGLVFHFKVHVTYFLINGFKYGNMEASLVSQEHVWIIVNHVFCYRIIFANRLYLGSRTLTLRIQMLCLA